MQRLLFSFLIMLSCVSPIVCESSTDIMSDCDSLLYACQEGDLDEVLLLLKHGIDVNCLSETGNTPLSFACAQGHLQVVKVLLEHKADVNIANKVGVTPFYRAASNGYIEIVKEFLNVKETNINAADNNGVTALFYASAAGHTDIVKELLKREDIDVNSLFDLGQTPLDVACNEEIKELLIAKGAVKFGLIVDKFNQFLTGVNNGDTKKLASVVSDQRSDLADKVQSIVKDGFSYDFNPNPIRKNAEIINPHKVKVTGIFTAKSNPGSKSWYSWELRGMSNYFVLEYINNEWFITETDFVQKLGGTSFWTILILIFAGLLFWIWMLIDCFNRDFNTRGRWFVFLIFFNVIAAVVYFFRIKMRNVHA